MTAMAKKGPSPKITKTVANRYADPAQVINHLGDEMMKVFRIT